MIAKFVQHEVTLADLRYSLEYYYPERVHEFDELMKLEGKRPMIRLLQENNILSCNDWIVF